jgi:hypothetical protein
MKSTSTLTTWQYLALMGLFLAASLGLIVASIAIAEKDSLPQKLLDALGAAILVGVLVALLDRWLLHHTLLDDMKEVASDKGES